MPTVYEVAQWLILAQGEGGNGDDNRGGDEGGGMGSMSNLMLLIGMISVMYIFLMVLPQRKQQKRMQAMIDNLKKNDRVLFGGGMVGTVVNVHPDKFVTLRIDDATNAKVRVMRSAISSILADEDSAEKKDDKDDAVKKKTS